MSSDPSAAMTRRDFLHNMLVGGAALLLPQALLRAVEQAAGPRCNVLFLAVDDLRPDLGCYGHAEIHSPHIDRLAKHGMVFEHAYCQQAVCAPSRASLLTGCRPDTTRIYDLETPLTSIRPDLVSLPKTFKHAGYETVSLGKIYHHRDDDLDAWSQTPWRPTGAWEGIGYLSEEGRAAARKLEPPNRFGLPYEAPDVADNEYQDGKTADRAIEELRRLRDRPFFLAAGFMKPHLPFNAPLRYWDLYKREDIRVPEQRTWPQNMPSLAGSEWGELRRYVGMPQKGPVPDDVAVSLIHGYRACVSFMDAQVGRIIDELDRLGLRERTVIVLWGDHGWKLGDYGAWCKHTNLELDTHAPLILDVPGYAGGQRTGRLVEFVDIYPTLTDACGLTAPDTCEGVSMLPLLQDPARPWKRAAFSQYPRGRTMGYSLRTERWRYTEWQNRSTGGVWAHELYDHAEGNAPPRNLADEEAVQPVVRQLAGYLREGWKGSLPPKTAL